MFVSPVRRALAQAASSSLSHASSLVHTSTSTVTHAVHKPSLYGQPLVQSHPHLFQRNDLTPGIPADDYQRRRAALIDSLPDGSLVVAVAALVKYMSANIFYKFRQASDFWYLTGFEEPGSAVILEKVSSAKGYKMTLFCNGSDSAKEKWDGPRTSLADAATLFHADAALPAASFAAHLRALLPLYSHVYVDLPPSTTARKQTSRGFLKYLASATSAKGEQDTILESLRSRKCRPLAPEVARLRAVKSEAELGVMRRAAEISGRAHAKTMRFTQPGMSESAVAAHFEYICAVQGSERPAYVPVVASGANALIIHYTANNQLVREGELVLVDAGCELNGYASDITRTYPASGTFTPAQADLYSAVLAVQKQLITLCTADHGWSLNRLHVESCRLLKAELRQIGFVFSKGYGEGDLERVLYPHYLSHPIGIDLHESNGIDRSARLKAGMVITIEPGIYVPPTPSFPTHFHNIGIRIEDEVLVGEKHPVVLSVSAPKEIADVEGACQGLLGFEPY